MKPLLIVNPRAGGGRTGAVFGQMRAPIEHALGPVDVALTEGPRHATELARQAAVGGRETVVAVGGDGCIHEVVNGLMLAREGGAKPPRLGIIGQGTGGDFRKALGIDHRLDRYCSVIAAGATRAIDIGRFSYADHEGRQQRAFFMNILSVGIGGLVDRYVADISKALGGTLAYFGASLKGLANSVVGIVASTIDDGGGPREVELRTRSVAICNGRYFGSGMHVAPMARLDDGLFDVVDLGSAPRVKFGIASSRIYSGRHLDSSDVHHYRCRRITMHLVNEDVSDRFLLDVDGEQLGRLPLDVEVVPRAIDVFAPAASA